MMHDVGILIIAIIIGVLALVYGIHELKWIKDVTKRIKELDNTKP